MRCLNLLAVLLAGILLFSPATAECVNDGKCTESELSQNCLDCRQSVPEKEYCVDDGICNSIEKNLECPDCKEPIISAPSGLTVFVAGSGLIAFAVIAVVAFFAFQFLKSRRKRSPRL